MKHHEPIRRSLRIESGDGASATLELLFPTTPSAPDQTQPALFFLPALGVGVNPNLRFATGMARQGVAVAVMEWRGLGSSSLRAGRNTDWNYRHLLELDIPAALHAAREALPNARWSIGGHSLGGQLALVTAGQMPEHFERVQLIGSGHPYWRGFAKPWGVRAFAWSIPAITALAGHFPGKKLGFAGREAKGLMRDWAITCRRGDYRIPGIGDRLQEGLDRFTGRVHAVNFAHDWLATRGSLDNLRRLVPNAKWSDTFLGHDVFKTVKADHFGWLKEPDPVVHELLTAAER